MAGKVYGIGVGPGDPELMTLKAVRLIKEADVVIAPGKDPRQSVAYKIAVQSVPELADKQVVPIEMPMIKNREVIEEYHLKGADLIQRHLDEDKMVVFISLGDSTVYCTFTYLQRILKKRGYDTELVNGIPSFCAAAARLNTALVEWDEQLHIIPAVHKTGFPLTQPGTYVLMKSAHSMPEIKEKLKKEDRYIAAIENCGFENEAAHYSIDEIPDESSYFTTILAKDQEI